MIIGSGFDECPTTILAELRLTVIYEQMHLKTIVVRRMIKKNLHFHLTVWLIWVVKIVVLPSMSNKLDLIHWIDELVFVVDVIFDRYSTMDLIEKDVLVQIY